MSHSKTLGLSDIIGPIMVGPSSSHTAGALRIALMAHELMGRPPKEMRFTLYGSFAHTYRGHGTDRALVAGLLGFRPDDLRIRDSFEIARAKGISFDFQVDSKTKPRHPNTVDVWVRDAAGEVLSVRGESIGGGAARLTRVDGIKVEITGEYSAAIIYQRDMPGVLGFVASTLGDAGINIGNSTILRERKGGLAYNVLEVDSAIPDEVQQVLLKDPRVLRIRFIPAFSLAEGARAATPRYTPEEAQELFPKLDYQDGTSILTHAYTYNISLGHAFLDREELLLAMQGKDMSGTCAYLDRALQVMRESIKAPLEHGMHTMGGLIGGEAHALMQLCAGDGESHPSDRLHQVFSGVFPKAAAYAMAVLETNASMGRIVAAPTAGSAGVLPGVIAALNEAGDFSQEELRDAQCCRYRLYRDKECDGCRCRRRLPGRDRYRLRHGSKRSDAASRRLSPAVSGCSRHRAHESAWPRLRSGRRTCRGALPEAQRFCCCKCARLVRACTCRHPFDRLLRRDSGCAETCRTLAAIRAQGDRPGRHCYL